MMTNIAERVDVQLQQSWIENRSEEGKQINDSIPTHDIDTNMSNLRVSSPAKVITDELGKLSHVTYSETKPKYITLSMSNVSGNEGLVLQGTAASRF
jgi:hypothetical protein